MSFLFILVSSIQKNYFLNFYKKKKKRNKTFPFFENIKMSLKRIKIPTNFKEKEKNCEESG